MSRYTYEQLEQALGASFKLVPLGDRSQARIQTAKGFDIATIDLEEGLIEAALDAKWYAAAETGPDGFPDGAALVAARQEIAEELQPDWELAGFTMADEGALESYWYAKDPATRLPMYRVAVSKSVPTLEEALETIRWVRTAETETWV